MNAVSRLLPILHFLLIAKQAAALANSTTCNLGKQLRPEEGLNERFPSYARLTNPQQIDQKLENENANTYNLLDLYYEKEGKGVTSVLFATKQ